MHQPHLTVGPTQDSDPGIDSEGCGIDVEPIDHVDFVDGRYDTIEVFRRVLQKAPLERVISRSTPFSTRGCHVWELLPF
jgi:hypothetical protein